MRRFPQTPAIVTILPPREGFSPHAVGAIGLLVNRLGDPDHLVIGQGSAVHGAIFPNRAFLAAKSPLLPILGRVDRYMAGVVRTVRALRPAVIEVHNRANLALRLARALPAARVVLFIHNDPQEMRRAKTPADRRTLLARMHIVCISSYVQTRFMEGLDTAGPAPLVLNNSLDFSTLPHPTPPAARDKLILFAGRVVANKGVDAFVRACAATLQHLPGWRAEIIGADAFCPHGKATPFERHLAPAAHAAGITLRGYLPHSDVMAAMSRAAIVCVPSRWPEPFGLTALEAMANGAALICGARGFLPEIAGDTALYADPDVPGDLEATILRLAKDATLRANLAKAAQIRARRFDATQARQALNQVRANLLQNR